MLQASRIRQYFNALSNSRSPLRRDARIDEIRKLAPQLHSAAASDLQLAVEDLRVALAETPAFDIDSIVVPAFALVNESLRRTLGFEFYDVQFLAGIALTQRSVAEMHTGEGKTIVVALPAFVHALKGRGVHVATVNAYLAERDFELMKPLFELLGLSAGLVHADASPDEKRAAYDCDITYGTGHEFGFDYLRDQVSLRQNLSSHLGANFRGMLNGYVTASRNTMQRGLNFTIIDEIDSVLIDDATSPLVISEGSNAEAEDAAAHIAARDLIDGLDPQDDYHLDSVGGTVALTAVGRQRIYETLDDVPVNVLKRPWGEYVEQALRARLLFRRDVHYVLSEDGEVQIVDQSTGRIHDERKWRDGLHQAIEASQGAAITSDNLPLARITRQRFYRLYNSLCGMTGTTMGAEREFRSFYRMPVVHIPLRLPSRREIQQSKYYATSEQKWAAIVEEILTVNSTGRPILVGTRTIAASEVVAEQLETNNVRFQLLNGRQDEEEADIISNAGLSGAITIATNMAGRGTDIKIPDDVLAIGGLHVIATERHESRRVDRQLVGRSGRQGNPGSARFFVSADDYLISRHRPALASTMHATRVEPDGTIGDFTGPVLSTQRRVERKDFAARRTMFQMDKDRDTVMDQLVGTRTSSSESPAEANVS